MTSEQNVKQPNFYSDVCRIAFVIISIINVILIIGFIGQFVSGPSPTVTTVVIQLVFYLAVGGLNRALFKRGWPEAHAKAIMEKAEKKAALAVSTKPL